MSINSEKKILKFCLLLFFLILFIPLFYSINCVTDAYSFWHMAFIEKYAHYMYFPLNDPLLVVKNFPGFFSYCLLVVELTNIPIKNFQFLPIFGIVIPICYFILCYKLTNNAFFSVLTTFLMINIPEPMTFFTIWPHAFGFFLFMIYLLLFIHYFNVNNIRITFLILIIFISAHFYSYTVESWILFFSIYFFILLIILGNFLFKNITKNTINLSYFKSRFSIIILSFIIVFFYFNKIFYENYLAETRFHISIFESTEIFLTYYGNFFSMRPFKEYFFQNEPNYLLTSLGITYIISLIAIISLFLVYLLYNLIKKNKINASQFDLLLFLSILGLSVFDILIYAAIGTLQFRTIYFLFPILLCIIFNILKEQKKIFIFIIIILIVIISFHSIIGWENNKILHDNNNYKYIENSYNWISNYAHDKKILTDLRTGNKYLLDGQINNKPFEVVIINHDQYTAIVEDSKLVLPKYMVLNFKLSRIESENWEYYNPFSKYAKLIYGNKNQIVIYNDGNIKTLSQRFGV